MPPAHGASRLYDWQDDDDSGNDSPAAFSTVSVGGTLRGKQAQLSRAPVPGRAQPKRGSGRTSAPSRTSRTEFLFGADALPLGQPDESSVRQGSRPHRGASLDLEFGDNVRALLAPSPNYTQEDLCNMSVRLLALQANAGQEASIHL